MSDESLFDEAEFKGQRKPGSLKIVAGRKKKLTKNQQAFNRLTKRVEQLQESVRSKAVKFEKLLKVYLAEVPAQKRLVAEKRLKIAKALGESTKTIKYGKRQFENVRAVILVLCDEAFMDIEPDEETEAFYDAWSETSYKEEAQQKNELFKQQVAEHAREIYGIDIDEDEFDDTPEGIARFAKRLQDEYKKEAGQTASKRKTKKQLAQEELRKEEEARTLKSMRSIYLSLAKALHPDTITDPAEKAVKEELMKKVTAAYAAKDLSALLKLELEWVRSEEDALDTLPDDQLKLYIASLREQVEALEQEEITISMNPRFMCVSDLMGYPEPRAIKQIKEESREYARVAGHLDEIMSIFARQSKKEIVEFVTEYVDVVRTMQSMSEFPPF